MGNRPFSFYKKQPASKNVMMHFEEFSNVHNKDRSSNATRSSLVYKLFKNDARSRLLCRIAKRSTSLSFAENNDFSKYLLFAKNLKAGFHLCEFGRTIAQPVVWACVVRFTEEDSPAFGDRATDFGSWIDFNFSATSTNRANQIALILQ